MQLPISASLSDAHRKVAFEACKRVRHECRSVEFRWHYASEHPLSPILRAADDPWLTDRSGHSSGERGMLKSSYTRAFRSI